MARKKTFGFSLKRATGISSVKGKIARYTGIPTTKSGRRNKARRIATGGCLVAILEMLAFSAFVAVLIAIF